MQRGLRIQPMDRWAGPLVGSLWLGRLRTAEARPELLGSCLKSATLPLVGRTSLAEDAVIQQSVDRKVDVPLKKTYTGTHLALRAGTYVAQSLLSDLKALNSALDGSSDCSGLMSIIERQVEFLSDISFDVVRALALAEGACVSARRNLVLRDWKTDAAQQASTLRLPFQGNVLFGAELEEKLHKLFKEKKHSFSFCSTLGDRRLFSKKSLVQALSRRQFVRSQGRFPLGRGKKHKSPRLLLSLVPDIMTVLDLEVGGHLQHFLPTWALASSDLWVLDIVRHGYRIEFLSVPLLSGDGIVLHLDSAFVPKVASQFHRSQEIVLPSLQVGSPGAGVLDWSLRDVRKGSFGLS
ncbi:hypothetical protein NDU88_002154 [Pleurodeles waltl]|uniref:Lamina-associated polypeptide 2 alpha C-terminal domain-containing protein n=1 Tax=Pleurodeles waltl TaxID=8319 RepID=A0AAV7TJS8_PLEWA|nr:hypothetical protein NDU88_002154 [Pleurodeles waltl]